MFGDPKAKDPLFAVAIVARRRGKADPESGEPGPPSAKLTLSLEFVREAGKTSAASLAVEQFQRAYPEHDIIGHITEPAP